jgi:hypothetical protein
VSWLVSDLVNRWGSVVLSRCFEKLVAEAGTVRIPEEGERPPLEAATKQRLRKTEKILCAL